MTARPTPTPPPIRSSSSLKKLSTARRCRTTPNGSGSCAASERVLRKSRPDLRLNEHHIEHSEGVVVRNRSALHSWRSRILELEPVRRAAGAVAQVQPLGDDALAAELAGVLEHSWGWRRFNTALLLGYSLVASHPPRTCYSAPNICRWRPNALGKANLNASHHAPDRPRLPGSTRTARTSLSNRGG